MIPLIMEKLTSIEFTFLTPFDKVLIGYGSREPGQKGFLPADQRKTPPQQNVGVGIPAFDVLTGLPVK